jgi:hypothetical protein
MFSPSFLKHLLRLLFVRFTREQLAPHAPFYKHDLPDEEPDHERNIHDFFDDDLFERFYDDLD